MHYGNGREAKNGDKIVLISQHGLPVTGILYDAVAGNDYCNGNIAPFNAGYYCVNLKECLHWDDVLAAVKKDSRCSAPIAVEAENQ